MVAFHNDIWNKNVDLETPTPKWRWVCPNFCPICILSWLNYIYICICEVIRIIIAFQQKGETGACSSGFINYHIEFGTITLLKCLNKNFLSFIVLRTSTVTVFLSALQVLVYPNVNSTFSYQSVKEFSEGPMLTRKIIEWWAMPKTGAFPAKYLFLWNQVVDPLLVPNNLYSSLFPKNLFFLSCQEPLQLRFSHIPGTVSVFFSGEFETWLSYDAGINFHNRRILISIMF